MINFGDLFTIFKRENKAYFNSPIAYIFIIVFVLLGNGLFMTQFFIAGRAEIGRASCRERVLRLV